MPRDVSVHRSAPTCVVTSCTCAFCKTGAVSFIALMQVRVVPSCSDVVMLRAHIVKKRRRVSSHFLDEFLHVTQYGLDDRDDGELMETGERLRQFQALSYDECLWDSRQPPVVLATWW